MFLVNRTMFDIKFQCEKPLSNEEKSELLKYISDNLHQEVIDTVGQLTEDSVLNEGLNSYNLRLGINPDNGDYINVLFLFRVLEYLLDNYKK